MDDQKEAVSHPPVSASAQSTPPLEDVEMEESKEKEDPVGSTEEKKSSELSQTNVITSNVPADKGQDQVGKSDEKYDEQKDQPVSEEATSEKNEERCEKTVIDSVIKIKDEKVDVIPPVDNESSSKNVMEKVDEGVAEIKLTEQNGGEDTCTSKTLHEEKPAVINENIDTIKREEPDCETDKKDIEIKNAVPMDVDPPPSAHEPVQSEMLKKDGEETPVKDEDVCSQEEEIYKTDDWDFPPSDSEDGNFSSEPPPHVIIELYEKLAKEDVLDLEWTCLGKRTPEEEMQEMEEEDASKESHEETDNKPVEEDPTEFDFDIDTMMQNKVTPRRLPVFDQGGSGSAKKRVAQMDNVINDLRRFSKINEEMVKTGDGASPAPASLEVTPQRPLGKFHIRRDLHQ